MFDRLQKQFASIVVKPYLLWYLKKTRVTRLKTFELTIKPGVFHPKFFFSSRYLFDFVSSLRLTHKKFLEIGCGSGIISLLAHKKQAQVTCTDINPEAVTCTKENFIKNFGSNLSDFHCIESDLFTSLPPVKFDVIVVNPPYFFEAVRFPSQLAWNCGKNGEYFKSLFSGVKSFMHEQTTFFMILAENCEITRIKEIAGEYQLAFELLENKKIKWETNFIFKISRTGVFSKKSGDSND